MLDAAAYLDSHSHNRCKLESLDSISSISMPRFDMERISVGCQQIGPLHTWLTSISGHLEDEHFLPCNSKVLGYSLKTKLLCEFNVDHLSDITWNDVFPKLLLPPVYKNLMVSFAEGHAANEVAFDDIFEGKGLGVIILSLSSPGIG